MSNNIPVIGFAAYSGTGKTTLLKQLVPLLKRSGFKLAVIKHAHHNFDIDLPGKDSYELRVAGADQIVISSSKRFVKIVEQSREMCLSECLNELHEDSCDLILVEGFKQSTIKKIELHRPGLGVPLLCRYDQNIIAVATDDKLGDEIKISILDLNDPQQIVTFIVDNLDRFDSVLQRGS